MRLPLLKRAVLPPFTTAGFPFSAASSLTAAAATVLERVAQEAPHVSTAAPAHAQQQQQQQHHEGHLHADNMATSSGSARGIIAAASVARGTVTWIHRWQVAVQIRGGDTRKLCSRSRNALCTPVRCWSSTSPPTRPPPLWQPPPSAQAPTHVPGRVPLLHSDRMTQLKELLMLCVPHAPLCAQPQTIARLLQHMDPECVAWAPWHNNDMDSSKKSPAADVREVLLNLRPPTVKAVLQNMANDSSYNVYVSCTGCFVTAAASPAEAGDAFARHHYTLTEKSYEQVRAVLPRTATTASRDGIESDGVVRADTASDEMFGCAAGVPPEAYCMPTRDESADRSEAGLNAHAEMVRCRRVLAQVLQPRLRRQEETLQETYIPYFGDDFVPPPPPQLQLGGTPPQQQQQQQQQSPSPSRVGGGKARAVFKPEQLASLLPFYFVPIDALLAQLPEGYTEAHVRASFGETGTVELVQVGKETFVRFCGGSKGASFSPEMLRVQAERFGLVTAEEARLRDRDDGSYEQDDDDGSSNSNTTQGGTAEGEEGEAEVRLRRYITAFMPDPFLLRAFLPRLRRPFEWVPLYDLVQHAPTAVQKALLPLEMQRTLLYFAQQQHRVQFTPQNGGGVALHYPPTRHLRAETTPLPAALSELCDVLWKSGAIYVDQLECEMGLKVSDYTKRCIIAHFGTLRRFLYQHEKFFRLMVLTSPATQFKEQARAAAAAAATAATDCKKHTPAPATKSTEAADPSLPPLPASLPRPGMGFATVEQPALVIGGNNSEATVLPGQVSMVGRDAQLDEDGFPCWLSSRDLVVLSERRAVLRERHSASHEEQLARLPSSGSRNQNRKLRRRRAALENPDSPYSDPAVLLDAIVRYLPEKGHVSLRALLASLPSTMTDFLPNDKVRLFLNAPDKVRLFEFRTAQHLRLTRVGNPLPDWRLRDSYTKDEILYLVAAQLGPGVVKNAVHLYNCLPFFARETIRLHHRHLTVLLEDHPEYFMVAHQELDGEQRSTSRIALLRPLPPPATLSAGDFSVEELSQEEMASVVRRDRETLMADLSPDLRSTVQQ